MGVAPGGVPAGNGCIGTLLRAARHHQDRGTYFGPEKRIPIDTPARLRTWGTTRTCRVVPHRVTEAASESSQEGVH